MANYTKKAIFNAFEELLLEKPFDKITVSAIVAKSEISPNTFYYHFQDIYDLMDQWLDKKKDYLMNMFGKDASWEDILKACLHAMQANPKLVYHVSDSITRERLERYVFTSVEEKLQAYVEEKMMYQDIPEETRRLLVSFCCYSLLGYLLKFLWLDMNVDVDASVDNLSILLYGSMDAMATAHNGQHFS